VQPLILLGSGAARSSPCFSGVFPLFSFLSVTIWVTLPGVHRRSCNLRRYSVLPQCFGVTKMVLCASGLTRLLPKCIDHVTKNSPPARKVTSGSHFCNLLTATASPPFRCRPSSPIPTHITRINPCSSTTTLVWNPPPPPTPWRVRKNSNRTRLRSSNRFPSTPPRPRSS